MFTLFRTVSFVEGLSYLAILCVSAGFISREFVSILGMSHGGLFMLYLVLSLGVCAQQKWPLKLWLALFVASLRYSLLHFYGSNSGYENIHHPTLRD